MPDFISDTIQLHIASYFKESNQWKFLILKRSESDRVYPGIWQAVTGKVESNEKAIETAKRELLEECGIDHNVFYIVPYITQYFDPIRDLICHSAVFGVIIDENSEIKISDEHSNYEWISLEQSYQMLELPSHIEGNKVFFDYILNNPKREMFLYGKIRYE